MKSLSRISALCLPLLLTACQGSANLLPNSNVPVNAASTQTLSTPVQVSPTELSGLAPLKLDPIPLEPVDAATVAEGLKLRQEAEAVQTAAAETKPENVALPAQEVSEIRKLETQLKGQIQSEDQQHAELGPDFSVKSAQQGEDVDIELFLYHPTYGKRAKFWGIDNAKEFLMAGKSPTRRWLLRLKLEGLFAPSGFKYQVLFWVEQADLLRITGVSREDAWMLAANGITSVPDLARRTNSLEQTALLTSLKLMALQNGFDQPSRSDLEAWVNEAQNLEPMIY